MNTENAQFRDRVRREAVANGWPADAAAALAKHVGKRPPAGMPTSPPHRASGTRVHRAPGAQSTRNDRLDRMCGLYACPASLIAEMKLSGAALRTLADVLARACDGGKVDTPGRVERARLMLAAHAAQRGAA